MKPWLSPRMGVQMERQIDRVGAGAQAKCGATVMAIFLEVREGA